MQFQFLVKHFLLIATRLLSPDNTMAVSRNS